MSRACSMSPIYKRHWTSSGALIACRLGSYNSDNVISLFTLKFKRSKERYFKGERVELRRTPTINMPSSSTDEHGNTVSDDSDEHPVTPEHHMIRTESGTIRVSLQFYYTRCVSFSDSEESSLTFHISPRPSTRIIKRDQKGPRRPNSNSSSSQHQRRRPERYDKKTGMTKKLIKS